MSTSLNDNFMAVTMRGNLANPLYIPKKLIFEEKHDTWLTALISDDAETVKDFMSSAGEHDKQILLEGWINVETWLESGQSKSEGKALVCSTRRAWSLAAVACSHKVMAELVQAQIDIFQTDAECNNIIHSLIIHSSFCKESEQKLLGSYHYLHCIIPNDKFTQLLMMENSDRVRPLELAAHLQTIRFLDAIMNTPGAYLVKQKQCGLIVVNYYDVTEYESDKENRPWTQNPMFLLNFLGAHQLNDAHVRRILIEGILWKWMFCRSKAVLPFIWIWLLYRILIIIIAYFLADVMDPILLDVPNCGTGLDLSFGVRLASNIVIVICTSVSVIYDVYEKIRVHNVLIPKCLRKYPQKSGPQISRYHFYRGTQCAFNLALLALCMSRIIVICGGPHIPILGVYLLLIITIFGAVWSMFYFFQLVPSIGYYVMAIQMMLFDFLQFGILIFGCFIPFSLTFPRFISPDGNGTCPKEFSDTVSGIYSTFTVMLNMVDFRSFDAPSHEGLWLLHVLFVFGIAILLLNFLIAILSNSYNIVAANREVILCTQWMSISAMIDYRMPWFLKSLYCRLKMRQYTCEDGRYYVTNMRSITCDK